MIKGTQSWLFAIFVLTLIQPSLVHANGQAVMAVPPFHGTVTASPIKGWRFMSWRWAAYEYGISDEVFYEKKNCAFIRSVTDNATQCSLSQVFKANQYRSKRMRFSAAIKTESIDMSAALMMSIEGTERRLLSSDYMYGRNITGSRDWQRYKVVLDVPEESGYITFGISVRGTGEVWISSVIFEETEDAPTAEGMYTDEPINLEFSDV